MPYLVGDTKVYRCLHCPYISYSVAHMKQHFNDKHDSNPVTYDCPHCPYKARRKFNFKVHFAAKHE
jgi:hypothetical protein